MKNRRIVPFFICLALTGLTVFFGCDTGGSPPPEEPKTDPVPSAFVGTWKNTDSSRSDWQMEIQSDSKFVFSGTVQVAGGLVVAKGDLAKARDSGKYTITATEVAVAGASLSSAIVGGPLSEVDMKVEGNALTITPPARSTHIMALYIGGSYTKQ